MNEQRTTWTDTLAETQSFREMYALAQEIVGSGEAPKDVHRAAMRVMGALGDVIELPIADARILARARKRFGKLSGLLLEASGKTNS
jgi:hypothetical protein